MTRDNVELALQNVIAFGDTDIFPYPIENYIFFDKKVEVADLLLRIDSGFEEYLKNIPPINLSTCAPVGQTGFRWATQIDPLWNVYFLALVVSIGSDIEASRIPETEKRVFSYRFAPNKSTGAMFRDDVNWRAFQNRSLEIAQLESVKYVVICDIADFYTRIYHHRLENALDRVTSNKNDVRRIMKLLQVFSGTVSYGLPIGGPAARLLAELALDGIDRILGLNRISFCRFVDDFHLFAKTREEAQRMLTQISVKLLKNEGLSLSKSKTQILTVGEFRNLTKARLEGDSEDKGHKERARFSALHIFYDPYSPTANADYGNLKRELSTFDIVGLLNEELRKSRINQHFGRQLLKALDALEGHILASAIRSIMARIELFYPVFPSTMIAISKSRNRTDVQVQSEIDRCLRSLVENDSYMIQVELNAAYLTRILALERTVENEQTLLFLYERFNDSVLVRSLIIQAFARWRSFAWLSDLKSNFGTMTRWERRIFIIASYVLGDEGRHWRDHHKGDFTMFEALIANWASERFKIPGWQIPL